MVVVVTDGNFKEKILDSKVPVLVDFFATWCGPCKLAEPVLEALSEEHKNKVVIAKIDVDGNPEMTQKYSIMSIPTTVLFKNGAEVGRQVGFAGKKTFEDLINKE
ncbi:MAG: thioredoxin [bacterium]|nr:thioredoxin [bacterium]